MSATDVNVTGTSFVYPLICSEIPSSVHTCCDIYSDIFSLVISDNGSVFFVSKIFDIYKSTLSFALNIIFPEFPIFLYPLGICAVYPVKFSPLLSNIASLELVCFSSLLELLSCVWLTCEFPSLPAVVVFSFFPHPANTDVIINAPITAYAIFLVCILILSSFSYCTILT